MHEPLACNVTPSTNYEQCHLIMITNNNNNNNNNNNSNNSNNSNNKAP